MAARNRVVGAGGGESNGITQGVNDQTVNVFQGLQQLAGTYIENVSILPNITLLSDPWYRVEYV